MKGITIPCPECKQILIRYAVVKGEVTFQTKCVHCQELVMVSAGQEPWITACKVRILIAILLIAGAYQIFSTFKLHETITAVLDNYEIEIHE